MLPDSINHQGFSGLAETLGTKNGARSTSYETAFAILVTTKVGQGSGFSMHQH